MKQDEFERRLAEFAEVKALRPPTTPNRRETDEPEDIFRQGVEFQIDRKNNPTWALEVKKLKPQVRKCEYCGDEVIKQTFNKRIVQYPRPFWKESCSSCRRVKNPITGKFDLTEYESVNFFTTYFRNRDK